MKFNFPVKVAFSLVPLKVQVLSEDRQSPSPRGGAGPVVVPSWRYEQGGDGGLITRETSAAHFSSAFLQAVGRQQVAPGWGARLLAF